MAHESMVQSFGPLFSPSKDTLWQLQHISNDMSGQAAMSALEQALGEQRFGLGSEQLELSFNDYLKMHLDTLPPSDRQDPNAYPVLGNGYGASLGYFIK